MPILWRYLLIHYFRVLSLAILAFIAVLMTTRLDEIANFATLGPSPLFIIFFALYQIPYILPIVLPISALISTILLIQRLSTTHELTALRASGISISQILTPILMGAALMGLVNFYIISELATHSHLTTTLLKDEWRLISPLVLLQNKQVLKLKGLFFHTLGLNKIGESASDVILAIPNHTHNRLHVLLAKNLTASSNQFSGKAVTLFTILNPSSTEMPDSILVENMDTVETTLSDFNSLIQKKIMTIHNDHLSLAQLNVKWKKEKLALQAAQQPISSLSSKNDQKSITDAINGIISEILRRSSVALAVFTFSLMGAAFGMSISRYYSNHRLFIVVSLTAFYLITFFAAKQFNQQLFLSSLFYLAPHCLIFFSSLVALRRVVNGIE